MDKNLETYVDQIMNEQELRSGIFTNFFDVIVGAISCLLYTSDAADDLLCVDLGDRRIIKKKRYI